MSKDDDLPDNVVQLTLHDALGTEPANRPMDWGALAQTKAEKHLAACEAGLWCEQGECELEQPHDPANPICARQSPACAPYCGCQTCQIREILWVAWPYVERAVAAGQVRP